MVYVLAFLKNAIYGTSVFFTSRLTDAVNVFDILALRFLMSFVVLWILKSLKAVKINVGIKDFFVKNSRSDSIRILLGTAIFEPVLYMLFETFGIAMTTGITSGVILSLTPVSCCIFEALILKEKTTLGQKFFLGLGIIGVMYIAINTNTTTGENSMLGILFMFFAVISGSLFLVFSRKASRAFSTMEITYIYNMLGLIAFNFINVIRHLCLGNITTYFTPYFNLQNIIGFLFLAIVSALVATGMNNFILSKMQASTLSAFGGVSTLVTIAVSILWDGERLQGFHIIGLILILARMIGVSYIAIQRDKTNSENKSTASVNTAAKQPEHTEMR